MELVDLAKQKLDRILPGRHQSILLGLSVLLLVLTLIQNAYLSSTEDNLIKHSTAEATLPTAEMPEMIKTESSTHADEIAAATESNLTDKRLYLTVKPGDNLSLLFKRAGLGATDVYQLIHSSNDAKVLNSLYPGDKLAFDLADEKQLNSLELFKTPLESFLFTLSPSAEISFTKIIREPHIEVVYKEAVITDSLFLAALKGGIAANMTMDLAGIFNGVIDFILDTREGDTFNVVYEEEYLNGTFIGNGKILAASFTNQGVTYTAVRYKNAEGDTNFYNPEGESMRKAFLLNPVDFTRISSNFSLSRKHPILNTIRAHKGTDYAAPKGTPVVATADGRITFASRKGSFGKLVVVQHGNRFETKYAHLNDYAKGIKSGARVKQGQVIGYVGATGSATGPHLHFEFLMDGVHRNSRTIHDSLPKAESIPVSEMEIFSQQTRVMLSMLQTKGSSLQVSQSESPWLTNE